MAQISYGTITITDTTDIGQIINYYLTTKYSTGVTTEDNTDTDGWGTWQTYITPTDENLPYLWNYEKIMGTGTDIPLIVTEPHVIGMFVTDGTPGAPGSPGRGIVEIQDYYLVTDDININAIEEYVLTTDTTVQSSITYYTKSGDQYIPVTSPASDANPYSQGWYIQKNNWTTEIGVINNVDKYLWNYETVTYSDGYKEYIGPRLLGAYGDTGLQGIPGEPGTSSYVWIRYSANSDGSNYRETPDENTQYVGICVTQESSVPAYTDGRWQWSSYIGADGAALASAIPLYYLQLSGAAAPTNPVNGQEPPSGWVEIIPDYVEGGTYWTCIKNVLINADISPIYGTKHKEASLNHTKESISNLNKKMQFFLQIPNEGFIVAGGDSRYNNGIPTAGTPTTYGYNTIMTSNYLGLRYQDKLLTQLSDSSLSFYNPTNNKAQIILDNNGLTLKDINGNTIALYGSDTILGNPSGAHLELGDSDIIFYTEENKQAAKMTASALEIQRTLAFNEMQLGARQTNANTEFVAKWKWQYDENDDSIFLAWI